ncbi:Rha family transcriptional regulator [Megamonas funiformis]|uniref:Rha family transcriptional regulator n=1 Tax=Megamonas funiformis TaxID=437897 RepID=UPI003F843714
MNELQLINENGKIYVDSRQVAKMIGKRHDNLIRDIDGYVNILGQTSKLRTDNFFVKSSYQAGTGKTYPCYKLTRKGCDMVANKLTGEKGVLFTAEYVTKFEEMEKQLNQISEIKITEYQQKELEIRENEAKAKVAELWIKLGDRTNIPEYRQITDSYASLVLAGKPVLPLPEVKEKTYSAGEIGKILGVSANKIGRLANEFNLKTEKYGKYFYDKSQYSNKEVESFRYYNSAIDIFKELLA